MKHSSDLTIHLICNAHLDPVWLWEWEEGAAEALSTFRIAAEFCEQFDGFVFNHNEVVLYEWVREYDPDLFVRIQSLVRAGKWHIMGGWYLQPDCNLPSGESMVRQILLGRRYFAKHFGVRPTTAINFDPFGHSRGLVQILARSGFDSYIFCRPFEKDLPLPADEFEWVGYDGSRVIGHRAFGHYLSLHGAAAEKIRKLIDATTTDGPRLVLWGIGNHGGGPSRLDMQRIEELEQELGEDGPALIHSTPEKYFSARGVTGADRPPFEESLNPWAPGCYTSQIRIKQQHRALEDDIAVAEKMAAHAAIRSQMDYPSPELAEAQLDLAFCQFHDILPGSAIKEVEEHSLARLAHGREIARRVIARAMMVSLRGDVDVADGDIPVFAYNPHPFPVSGTFAFEIQPSEQNWAGTFTRYEVRQIGADGEKEVPVQIEREASSVTVDWRKKLVIQATLPPSSVTRFDCTPLPPTPDQPYKSRTIDGSFVFQGDNFSAEVGTSGFLESYVWNGVEIISGPAFVPTVLCDVDDSWLTDGRGFSDVAGRFASASPVDVARITGSAERTSAVHVIEEGPVRTLVESILVYGTSWIVCRYAFSSMSPRIEVEFTVNWQEQVAMLKVEVPVATNGGTLEPRGQTMFGIEPIPTNGDEAVVQRWLTASCDDHALSIMNNGTYGVSASSHAIFLTLLRSVAYAAHPTQLGPASVPADRYAPRMDVGIREFRFAIEAGHRDMRHLAIDREAAVFGERPRFLMAFPTPGTASNPARHPAVIVDDPAIRLVAVKRSEDDRGWVLRLFEPTGLPRSTRISVPALDVEETVTLGGHEVATFVLEDGLAALQKTNLLEETNG